MPAPSLEQRLTRPTVEATAVTALVLLSLALRVLFVLAAQDSPPFSDPQMDALYHVEWARAFAAGEEYRDGPFFRAPLYPWALGVVFKLFGDGLLLPRLLQSALGASTTLLVYALGRRAFDRRTGLLAGLLHATTWIGVFYDAELLLEALATPLYLLALFLTLGLGKHPSRRGLLGTGLVYGLSAITRPNVLLFLPFLAAWLFARGPRGRGGLGHVALLALGTLAPILPVTAINAAEGDRVLISYQAGVNLWIGNHPQSDGSTAIAPGTRPDWWGGFEDTHAQAAEAEGRELRPSEVSAHYVRRTLETIADDPLRWFGHLAWKLRLYVMDWELGNNEEPRAFAAGSFLRWLPVSFGLLAALATVGVFAARARWSAHAPLALFVLVYSGSVVLFFVNARFRLPVLPVLAVYAAHGAWWILDAGRARRWGTAVGGLAVAVLLLGGSRALVPDVVRRNSESNGHLLVGQAELRAGNHAAALAELERALELWPRSGVAREALGHLGRELHAAGDYETAARAFRSLSTHAPRDFDALFSLGSCELALGRPERALEAFQRALDAPEPADAKFLYEAYGRTVTLLAQAGRPTDALRVAERMLERFPDDRDTLATVRRLRGEG